MEKIDKLKPGVFKVIRTSIRFSGDNNPPCDGAVLVLMKSIDVRTTDDPKKVKAYKGTDDWWYSRGENHRVEGGMIRRDMGWDESWIVEVPDVVEFVKKHGECIVGCDNDGNPFIEIYDDYRE